jgi:hypothetical protein
MKIPKMPKRNKHLKVINLVMTAHDNSTDAYKALLRFMNNKFRGSKYPILTLYLNSNSPLKKCLKGMIGATVGTDCYVSVENEEINNILLNESDKIHPEWQIFL